MLHVRREILRKNNGKSRFFHHSGSLNRSFLALCRVFFRRSYQKCNRIVPRNTLVENIFFPIKYLYCTLRKNSLAPWQNFFFGFCLKCISRVHRHNFKKTFFEKKFLFITLGCRAKFFLSKKSGGLEKSRFSVSIWKIWWITWFLKKSFTNLWHAKETLSAVCRNASTLYCTWKLHYTCPYKLF